ncbi:MAG TPA: phage holin family protein [Solirubrobacterales bacterium]
MTTPPDPRGAPSDDRSLGELVIDVSERVTLLVREEIELAKAEIAEKARKLLTGSVVGIVAGALAFLGFIMLMHAFAWLLNDLFFESTPWLGFLIEAVLWFLVAALAGLFAYRAVRAGSPPAPTMAIEEAKEIRETLEAGDRG